MDEKGFKRVVSYDWSFFTDSPSLWIIFSVFFIMLVSQVIAAFVYFRLDDLVRVEFNLIGAVVSVGFFVVFAFAFFVSLFSGRKVRYVEVD